MDLKLLKEAFDAGRDYQRGEYAEYNGDHEHSYPNFTKWYENKIKSSNEETVCEPKRKIKHDKDDILNTRVDPKMRC